MDHDAAYEDSHTADVQHGVSVSRAEVDAEVAAGRAADVASFREANDALNEAVRRRVASLDLVAEFRAEGRAYAELSDGQVVVRHPDGTSELRPTGADAGPGA